MILLGDEEYATLQKVIRNLVQQLRNNTSEIDDLKNQLIAAQKLLELQNKHYFTEDTSQEFEQYYEKHKSV